MAERLMSGARPRCPAFPWAAQCYEMRHGRCSLTAFVDRQIGKAQQPPPLYRMIATLPFRLILTTNYDTLLEDALREEGVAYERIINSSGLKRCRRDGLRVVKPYGCITDPGSLVLTEEDHFALFDRWPDLWDMLGVTLSSTTLLFMGCDVEDYYFRRLYRDLAPRLRKAGQRAYLIQPRGVSAPLRQYWDAKRLTVVEAEAVELLEGAAASKDRERQQGPSEATVYEQLELEVAWSTEPGRVRSANEDCIQVSRASDPTKEGERGSLYIVADGMGGHTAGEVASRLAVDVIFEEYYANTHCNPQRQIPAALKQAIKKANQVIHEQANESRTQAGMGTTAVAAVISGQELHVANVGDSRAYLICDGMIEQITLDHSWVAEELRAGRMTPEQARSHPQRSLLTRALGRDPDIEVDTFRRRVKKGDAILLCSDGLTEYVQDYELREEVDRSSGALAVRNLAELAYHRGGADNISIIVIKVT